MAELKPSSTAVGAAVLRAAHLVIDSEPKILDDPIAQRLLDQDALQKIYEHPERLQTLPMRALRAHILVRSRFAEDRLAEAVERGMDQLVVLGAGLDSFAYRQPAWASRLRIFEVDHAASQQAKRRRLERAGIAMPANLEYVAIDFETDTLASGFQRTGFDASRPAFFSWLGVAIYLREPAIESVFRFAVSLPQSSEIAFTFGSERRSADSPGLTSGAETRAAGHGEPWLTRFHPQILEQKLRGWGFSEVVFLTPEQIAERYIHDRSDGLVAPKRINTASARV